MPYSCARKGPPGSDMTHLLHLVGRDQWFRCARKPLTPTQQVSRVAARLLGARPFSPVGVPAGWTLEQSPSGIAWTLLLAGSVNSPGRRAQFFWHLLQPWVLDPPNWEFPLTVALPDDHHPAVLKWGHSLLWTLSYIQRTEPEEDLPIEENPPIPVALFPVAALLEEGVITPYSTWDIDPCILPPHVKEDTFIMTPQDLRFLTQTTYLFLEEAPF